MPTAFTGRLSAAMANRTSACTFNPPPAHVRIRYEVSSYAWFRPLGIIFSPTHQPKDIQILLLVVNCKSTRVILELHFYSFD